MSILTLILILTLISSLRMGLLTYRLLTLMFFFIIHQLQII